MIDISSLSSVVLIMVILLILLYFVFFIWTIIDVFSSKMKPREKFAWVFAILGWGVIMGVVWLFLRKKAHSRG